MFTIDHEHHVLKLSYAMDKIQEEISMRTSYLGKNRSAEGTPHLLDLVHMSKDETELFVSFMQTAMADVYDAVGKYGKRIGKDSFEFNPHTHTITYTIEHPRDLSENYIRPLDIAVKEALVCHITADWLSFAYPNEQQAWATRYAAALDSVYHRLNQFFPNVMRVVPRWF